MREGLAVEGVGQLGWFRLGVVALAAIDQLLRAARLYYDGRGSGEELLSAAVEFFTPPPDVVCSRCGRSEDDNDGIPLIDVRVIVHEGEEGFADITQWLCEAHFERARASLEDLGFVDHNHGGINFLEDSSCPGFHKMADCPHPSQYGNYVVSGL